MSLDHGLLELFNYTDMTGYDLAKTFHDPLYSYEQYTQMADASWDIKEDTETLTEADRERGAAGRFTRQMAAAYKPNPTMEQNGFLRFFTLM